VLLVLAPPRFEGCVEGLVLGVCDGFVDGLVLGFCDGFVLGLEPPP
jgi:hypothetical protein